MIIIQRMMQYLQVLHRPTPHPRHPGSAIEPDGVRNAAVGETVVVVKIEVEEMTGVVVEARVGQGVGAATMAPPIGEKNFENVAGVGWIELPAKARVGAEGTGAAMVDAATRPMPEGDQNGMTRKIGVAAGTGVGVGKRGVSKVETGGPHPEAGAGAKKEVMTIPKRKK